MNILHLSAVRVLTNGQRQQLCSESAFAVLPHGASWSVRVIHGGRKLHEFDLIIPNFLNFIFVRYFICWCYLVVNWQRYDLVLMRYLPFDPVGFILSRFVRNRISLHHAREPWELLFVKRGWKGRMASMAERILGPSIIRSAIGIAGVTPEIARFQKVRSRSEAPIFWLPNGVDCNAISLLEDNREDCIEIGFVCGTFNPWHGLEKLIAQAQGYTKRVRIHLIGKIPSGLSGFAIERQGAVEFVAHGFMDKEKYAAILSRCWIGLGSLNMGVQGLTEGSTLKVREYLSMGLPVYTAHLDPSFPLGFPYYCSGSVCMDQITAFAELVRLKSRKDVRDASVLYVDKLYILRRFSRDIMRKLINNKQC